MKKKNIARPQDWPVAGSINLDIHDLPHRSLTTEWWYVHTHIEAEDGKRYALFASFFIKLMYIDKKTKQPIYGHSLTWAISDIEKKEYHYASLVDQKSPKYGLEKLKSGEEDGDKFLKRAAMETLKKDVVPLPDEMFEINPVINWNKLNLQYDRNSFVKKKDNSYHVKLVHKGKKIGANLRFVPKCKPILHAEDGYQEGVFEEDMFYYFIPKCSVEGTITVEGKKLKIKSAKGWYDHEFGYVPKEKKRYSHSKTSWNWVAIKLDNDCDITAYNFYKGKSNKKTDSTLLKIDGKGKLTKTKDFELRSFGEKWVSLKTFCAYPCQWKLISKKPAINLTLIADFPEQEFCTVISRPAFWEGSMKVTGTVGGKKVKGRAYFERKGFNNLETLEDFLKAVSKETLKSVKYIIPSKMDSLKLQELVSKKGNTQFTNGVLKDIYSRAMIQPIREITDRGGKAWRSYATVACCDIVGGNSQHGYNWLALPELMHVGSLIIDDVQDDSDVRRGGKSTHEIYGKALAINSGSMCNFLGQICVYHSDLKPEDELKVYHLYFEAIRAAHSGQALDIYGFDYMMDDVIYSNQGRLLVSRVKAVHRLKSAAPASYLAMIGALSGHGNDEQVKGLGDYFATLGTAFQIIDDVLNLKGFKENLKTRGEDITAGKMTYPLAKMMVNATVKEKERIWEIIQLKTKKRKLIEEVISLLAKYQILEKCEKEANSMVERAWRKLDPLVEDSLVKQNLRAFSWYLLEREY